LFPAYSNNLIDDRQGIMESEKSVLAGGKNRVEGMRKTINLA
jgi:hypothetical protein